jgi:hypothetical protein
MILIPIRISIKVRDRIQIGLAWNSDFSHISPVREHETTRLEPLVPGVEDSVQHGLVEEAVAHPLRDDDVNLNRNQHKREPITVHYRNHYGRSL